MRIVECIHSEMVFSAARPLTSSGREYEIDASFFCQPAIASGASSTVALCCSVSKSTKFCGSREASVVSGSRGGDLRSFSRENGKVRAVFGVRVLRRSLAHRPWRVDGVEHRRRRRGARPRVGGGGLRGGGVRERGVVARLKEGESCTQRRLGRRVCVGTEQRELVAGGEVARGGDER
jgi:hypothetical protein